MACRGFYVPERNRRSSRSVASFRLASQELARHPAVRSSSTGLGYSPKPAPQAAKPPASESQAKSNAPAQPAAQATPATQLIPGLNVYADATVRLGALSCAARVNQVTDFLVSEHGTKAAGFVFPAPAPADKRLLSLSLSIASADIPQPYVGASFAPGQAAGCEASYDIVSYWPQSCTAVASARFPGAQPGTDMGGLKTLVLGARARVFLLQAGAGCVSIKKEFVAE